MTGDKLKIEISEDEWEELSNSKKKRLRELVLEYFDIDILDVISASEEEDDEEWDDKEWDDNRYECGCCTCCGCSCHEEFFDSDEEDDCGNCLGREDDCDFCDKEDE